MAKETRREAVRFAIASADGAEGVREAAKRGPSLQFDGTLYAACVTWPPVRGHRSRGSMEPLVGARVSAGILAADGGSEGVEGTRERKAQA